MTSIIVLDQNAVISWKKSALLLDKLISISKK